MSEGRTFPEDSFWSMDDETLHTALGFCNQGNWRDVAMILRHRVQTLEARVAELERRVGDG